MIWTLRSNDADGNETVDKTIGLISTTTALQLLFLHYYDVKMPNSPLYFRT